MRLAFCVTVKNRSCVVVDKEDSLSYLQHARDKILESPDQMRPAIQTIDTRLALLLLPTMIRSLVHLKRPEDDWVIVVVDYGSTDVSIHALLTEEIGQKLPWHLETVTDYAYFDRGGGLAKAAQIAEQKFQADSVFFCDADLLFSTRDVIQKAVDSIARRKFFYPIFFSFVTPDHSRGFWRDTSYGNFACALADYKQTEGWYHNLSWGWEDRALSDSIPEDRKDRERVLGFFHQWHPFQWEFRVKEYPRKDYMFREAAVKSLPVSEKR